LLFFTHKRTNMADEVSIESGSDTVRNKIVFVGDVFVGKTTVMSRFTENNYKENYDVINDINLANCRSWLFFERDTL